MKKSTSNPVMVRAGHAARASRYLNEVERLEEERKGLTKRIRELKGKAKEQQDLADSIVV